MRIKNSLNISMSGNQTSQNIDTLSVRKIYAKGDNNTILAANSMLVTDGKGGTQWMDMSTFQRSIYFNQFETTQSTFTSGPLSSKFTILDGTNAGLIPSTSGNSVSMYAKAFGQVDVSGQTSIYSFDTYTGTINSNIQIAGSGIIDIRTNTATNKISFYSPDTGLSSLSSVVKNFIEFNSSLSNTISSFNSPFSTFIYDAISSFSTALGPVITTNNFSSVLSTQNYVSNLKIGTLNTSTIQQQGLVQPAIQYGSNTLNSSGSNIITLPTQYINGNYAIQLSYSATGPAVKPLFSSTITSNNFHVYGDNNASFHWTTFGSLF